MWGSFPEPVWPNGQRRAQCLDLDRKIRILEEGIPIHEPGWIRLIARNVAAGRLHFTTNVQEAVQFGTIQFSIAVRAPPDELAPPITVYCCRPPAPLAAI